MSLTKNPSNKSSNLRSSIRKDEKNRFGEVFTPPDLINAMLHELPLEVWTDPTKKWLDPAAGFGNFFMEVYPLLMKSLEHVIPEPAKRRRHILTQMLYMTEVNEASCARIRENPVFFNKDDEGNIVVDVELNLLCGSFLDQAVGTTAFKDRTTEFDIIVGNPPFNSDQKHEGKKGGGSNLWPMFVDKSLRGDLLKPNGYLLFVHPALWRKPPSLLAPTQFDMMTHENHMLYLEIHSKSDGYFVFGAQTRYDYYVIKKSKPTPDVSTTVIVDQRGIRHESVDLSRWQFLPNDSYELIGPLLRDPTDTSEPNVIFSRGKYGTDKRWVHEGQQTPKDIPLIHSTPIKGPRILWSDPVDCVVLKGVEDCVPMVGVPKVIFGESGINKVVVDIDGIYGMTQCAIGLKIPGSMMSREEKVKEAGIMASVLESDIFHDILDSMSYSNFRIDWRMFLYLRPDFYRHPMFSDVVPYARPSFTKNKAARKEPPSTQRKKPKKGGRANKKMVLKCKTRRHKKRR